MYMLYNNSMYYIIISYDMLNDLLILYDILCYAI